MKRRIVRYKNLILVLIGLVAVIIGISVWYFLKTPQSSSKQILKVGDTRLEVSQAKAQTTISKGFEFPIKADKASEAVHVGYFIDNVELRDEIVVKGQKATALKGKSFLIINLKITNNSNSPIIINTKDYVRLIVSNNDKELIAPDIHNDPVEVQAISTKLTRLGFPVNDSDTTLSLKVGEINGSKTDIPLSFNK